MGAVTTLLATSIALSTIAAGTSVYSGMQQQAEAEKQANMAGAQAELQAKEVARQSVAQAGVERDKAENVRRQQKLSYLASGVSLEGSPLLVMETTRQKGISNVDEILTSGAYGVTAAQTEGRIKAQSLRASGRQAFMQGIAGGVSSLGDAANTGTKLV